MKDFYNSPVKVGDKVICMVKNYRSLQEAVVTKITDKMVLVEYFDSNCWNPQTRGYGNKVTYRIMSDQFVVVDSKPC